jgi:hypothetical protein
LARSADAVRKSSVEPLLTDPQLAIIFVHLFALFGGAGLLMGISDR